MSLAEAEGLLTHAYQQFFFMGHSGDIERTYTLRKKKLPENVKQILRDKYSQIADKFLQTRRTKTGPDAEELQKILREQLLLAAGLSQEELGKLNLSEMEQEKFQELLRQKLYGNALNHNGNGSQRIVSISQLDELIPSGYEFVSSLPGDRARGICQGRDTSR